VLPGGCPFYANTNYGPTLQFPFSLLNYKMARCLSLARSYCTKEFMGDWALLTQAHHRVFIFNSKCFRDVHNVSSTESYDSHILVTCLLPLWQEENKPNNCECDSRKSEVWYGEERDDLCSWVLEL
jgi:hypothetical protein